MEKIYALNIEKYYFSTQKCKTLNAKWSIPALSAPSRTGVLH